MAIRQILTRDFVLNFLATFFLSFVFCILIPTIPIYLSGLSVKEAEIGVLVGILSVASLVLRPFVGRALVKTTEKKCMVIGILLFFVTSLGYLISPPFWPLLIVRIFQGIGVALFYTASFTLIANTSPEAYRGRSLSYFYLSLNIAFAIAPYVGILLIEVYSFAVLFWVCGGLSLCAFLATIKLGKRETELLDSPVAQGQPFLERGSLPSAFMAFLLNIPWGALVAFFPLYALSKGVDNPGTFFAVFAIVMIVTRASGAKILDRARREKIILPCIVAFIVAMGILAFSTTLPMFVLVATIWGVGNGFLYPTLVAQALDQAGPYRGPAMGTFTAIADLGSGMGSVIMGVVLAWTNYPMMFLSLALVGVLNLIFFFLFFKKRAKIVAAIASSPS